MLAPVLARLSRIPELARAQVDAAGRLFLLELAPGADPDGALAAARAVLGARARPVPDAEAQLESVPRGDRWFTAEDIRGLSYVEARVLAARVCDRALREVPLETALADRLEDAAVVEIRAALDRVHDEGGRDSSAWFDPAWPGIAAAIAARLRQALDADGLAALREALLRART
ncbi:hypothetical protein [Anaeromyxobacter terrae]|uniref:hypothetical protein n=1 Tax=Anaeromyxobacter terrae TaxID=2925406 RepID=UPI001F572474|nr:hypothetical protein [Anaeromyxobacter sp. SG22]